jgi:anti-anti-sigma factor
MDIVVQEAQGAAIVAPTGRLDATNAREFEAKVDQCIAAGHRQVVMDFAGLEYISSAGLRSILAAAKTLKARQGVLSLCRVSGLVRDVLSVSGFDSFLTIYADRAQALARPSTP